MKTIERDAEVFTQGLVIDGSRLLESGGGYGRSALILRKLEDATRLNEVRLPATIFAEGLTVFASNIIQLSWREHRALIWNRDLQLIRELRYEGEGWGLTHDGTSLISSDGSDELAWRDPDTLAVRRRLKVHEGGVAVDRLNELEYVRGWVLANVWKTDRIALIDPADGGVRAWLDLSGLRARLPSPPRSNEDVLNGIAYDAAADRLYVTGKRWPLIFVLKLPFWPPSDGAPPASEVDGD